MNNANCKKSHADFNHVEPHQMHVHDRLRNWARWVVVRPQSKVQPMFKFYKAPPQWGPRDYREPCDLLDAQKVEKAVAKLAPPFAYAIRWFYVYSGSPSVARKALGTTYFGVARYVRDGRQMMINLIDV